MFKKTTLSDVRRSVVEIQTNMLSYFGFKFTHDIFLSLVFPLIYLMLFVVIYEYHINQGENTIAAW